MGTSAQPHPHHHHLAPVESYLVRVDVGGAALEGQLAMPAEPRGIVLFAHGNGSSRHSPHNKFVAQALREDASVGTLLIDLLSPAEDAGDPRTAQLRFDIELLASRLVAICDWLERGTRTAGLPIGLFGASTGAAAALIASIDRPDVAAIVSRSGRPDLVAAPLLARVRAPALLIVGGDDLEAIDVNRRAAQAMRDVHELSVVPLAGHRALVEASRRAAIWFDRHLPEPAESDEPRG
jgi:dienelactone hydrolase